MTSPRQPPQQAHLHNAQFKAQPRDFLEVIKARRSIRKYKDVPVEWDKIVNMLMAGQYAPTAGNLQDFKFIVVNDPQLRREVAQACVNQMWMETAPVHIVITGIPERTLQYYGEIGNKYVVENCANVAMSLMLQATVEGLGTCWVGAFDELMLRLALGIPDRATPMMIITVGYPDEEVPTPPRTVIESLAFLQKYGNRVREPHLVWWDWSMKMEEMAKGGKNRLQKWSKQLGEKMKKKLDPDDKKE